MSESAVIPVKEGDLLAGKYDLSFTVPSQCAEALRAGEVDIAIIPAIEYQRIDDLVILPDLAIASKRRVRSLLLISTAPLTAPNSAAISGSTGGSGVGTSNPWSNIAY